MLIKTNNKEDLVELAAERIKVLKAKLEESRDNEDSVASRMIKDAIEQIQKIKNMAKQDFEIFLDEDDRFVLGLG